MLIISLNKINFVQSMVKNKLITLSVKFIPIPPASLPLPELLQGK